MIETTIIQRYISEREHDKALEALNQNLQEQPENAEMHYLRGKLFWRLGNRKEAITEYEHAVQIDPQSPAASALEMSRDIMDFFNPDLLNP